MVGKQFSQVLDETVDLVIRKTPTDKPTTSEGIECSIVSMDN